MRAATKHGRILQALIEGRKLTRFDAERLRDHCLPSTVSALQRMGVVIQRKWIAVNGACGPFRCCEYWLDGSAREAARTLLEDRTHD